MKGEEQMAFTRREEEQLDGEEGNPWQNMPFSNCEKPPHLFSSDSSLIPGSKSETGNHWNTSTITFQSMIHPLTCTRHPGSPQDPGMKAGTGSERGKGRRKSSMCIKLVKRTTECRFLRFTPKTRLASFHSPSK